MKIFDYTCSNITCKSYGKQMSNGRCLDCNVIAYDKDREISIELTKEEASALIRELGKTFIDRDNPLCNEVLTKLMRFIQS